MHLKYLVFLRQVFVPQMLRVLAQRKLGQELGVFGREFASRIHGNFVMPEFGVFGTPISKELE